MAEGVVTQRQRRELEFTVQRGGSVNILRRSTLYRTYAALARKGLMTQARDWLLPGIYVFSVTDDGRKALGVDSEA